MSRFDRCSGMLVVGEKGVSERKRAGRERGEGYVSGE